MSSSPIDRFTEDDRIPPKAAARLWSAHQASCRLALFDDQIAELARNHSTIAASDLDSALEPTLALLGEGLRADRVYFYVAEPLPQAGRIPAAPRFDLRSSWTRPDPRGSIGQAPQSIDLDSLIERGQSLRWGEPQRLPRWPAADRAWSTFELGETGAESGVIQMRTLLLLPCVSAAGLNGFFALDAGLIASAWTHEWIGRTELVARQFALVLERHGLALELAGAHKRRAHDERLETLGRVASGVAHDFNNVLTAILGYADLVELELLDQGVSLGAGPTDLDEIREAAERAVGLAEQVLSVGRTHEREDQPTDLDACVMGFASMVRRVLGDGVDLSLDLALETPVVADADAAAAADAATADPSESPKVRLDPARFERVLLNLASNARCALRENARSPRFELVTRVVRVDGYGRDESACGSAPIPGLGTGEYARLTARDNGCGVDPAAIERIFEPFFTTKGDSGGSGLGLATAAEIVSDVGGGIRVESTPGEGAAFHLYFPIERCTSVASETACSRVSERDVPAAGSGPIAPLDPRGPHV